jgi:hypothetical protein
MIPPPSKQGQAAPTCVAQVSDDSTNVKKPNDPTLSKDPAIAPQTNSSAVLVAANLSSKATATQTAEVPVLPSICLPYLLGECKDGVKCRMRHAEGKSPGSAQADEKVGKLPCYRNLNVAGRALVVVVWRCTRNYCAPFFSYCAL